jgi:heme a synthase
MPSTRPAMWLHRYAQLVSAATILLIVAGGLVTSTGSGLSVPDWPTTYGSSMFTFPPSRMVGGIYYEHGHRLIASAVGLLTIGLTAWIWLADRRRWMKWLGAAALKAVIVQGVLGGVTVLWLLPPSVSVAHAGLAQAFFCLTVALALFTSPGWQRPGPRLGGVAPGWADDSRLRVLATATTVVVYTQILIGAAMRHTGAGLAIPDFPLVFGGLVPRQWTPEIAINYAHRLGAVAAAVAVAAVASRIWQHHRTRPELTRPSALLAGLVLAQIAIGGLTVLTQKAVAVNTAHVATGALVLATSLVLTLRAYRVRFAADSPAPTVAPGVPVSGRRSPADARA